jgi:hypothetical protein
MLIGIPLFFIMMFAPQSWQLIKIPLVVLSVILLLVHNIISINRKRNVTVLLWFSAMLIYGSIWSFIGAVKGNLGAADFFKLNVIWCLLYFGYVLYIDSFDKFYLLIRTMVWATIAISLYNISILLNVISPVPNLNSYLMLDGELSSEIGIHSGFIQLSSINIGSLCFLTPFVLVLLITNAGKIIGTSNLTLTLSVVLSIITVLISGRRALLLEMLVTPILAYLLNIFSVGASKKIINRNIFVFYSILVLIMMISGFFLVKNVGWSIASFNDRLAKSVESGDVRREQAVALFNGFTENPIIGVGFGEGVDEVIRSEERPWTYELSYSVILYTTGIIGSSIYLCCLLTVFYKLLRSLKSLKQYNQITIPILVAFSCFLIANGTNPYLGSYDFMWMLYLPMAYINSITNR